MKGILPPDTVTLITKNKINEINKKAEENKFWSYKALHRNEEKKIFCLLADQEIWFWKNIYIWCGFVKIYIKILINEN